MLRLGEYITNKYKLTVSYDIDLVIHSKNVTEKIIVSPVDDRILIKYADREIESSRKMMYKDLTYILDHLSYVYFMTSNNDMVYEMMYDGTGDLTLIDEAEDYIWKNRDNENIDKIFVLRFAGEYNFEASVSGSFVDTYWQIFDEAHYSVVDAAATLYKYREKDYVSRYKSLMTAIIPSEYNLNFLRKYFLDTGYAFLLDYPDRETKKVYQMVDIDFDNCKNIAGDQYLIVSSDYKSIIAYDNGRFYIRGNVDYDNPTFDKILQVDDMPCKYIHSLKTSRVLYNGDIYEASGKTVSDCLNKLNKLLSGKIVCCFSCKYGSYTTEEKEIYCMNGFNPKDFADVLYMVDESKMIPYDQFNLCDSYELPSDDFYTHTLYKAVDSNE